MAARSEVLIIGAGPTGLAAALFLAELGHRPRIVEQASTITPYSKAFGVNVRSLHLLEPSGVTKHFLENGRRMHHLALHRQGKELAKLHFATVDQTYPFMCVQSQADSERILAEAVTARGIEIERGVRSTAIHIEKGSARVELQGPNGAETVHATTVLGADGAGSMVRKSLAISFSGKAYPEPWRLWDLELDVPLDPDDGHIFLLNGGGMFVVRHKENVWRVLGSGPDLLESLPSGTRIGKVHWQSEFQIANRVAGRFGKGPVFLAGDAAHIHAGIGARGMNLGIEDAWVFAELFHKGQLDRYNKLRRPVVRKVVGQIERMMSVPRADTLPGRVVRAMPWLVRAAVPLMRSRIEPWILGLDHEVKV